MPIAWSLLVNVRVILDSLRQDNQESTIGTQTQIINRMLKSDIAHVTCHFLFKDKFEQITVWTAKAEMGKVDHLAVGEACKAKYTLTSSWFKDTIFDRGLCTEHRNKSPNSERSMCGYIFVVLQV